MRRIATGVLLVMLLGALAGCASAPDTSTPAGFVSVRCTRCHAITRIKAAQKPAAGWKVTIDRMRTHGLEITEQQEEQVVDFLAGGGAAGL